ncbi:putative cation-transporting ATPase F [compost metagenome]
MLLLFVLFENLQTFSSRSERHSVFRQGVFANPMLVVSVLAAQLLHIAAMYIPGLSDTLGLTPVSATTWAGLLSLALTLTIAVELDKWWSRRCKL